MSHLATTTVGTVGSHGAGPEALAVEVCFRDLFSDESLKSTTWAKEEARRAERDGLYELCRRGRDQEAAQRLLAALDGELRAGNFSDVDELLTALDVTRLGSSVLLTALTITAYAKPFLRKRNPFLNRAERQLRTTLGDRRAEALLSLRR